MRRSNINDILAQSDDFMRSFGVTLPPFAYWSVDEFRANAHHAGALIEAHAWAGISPIMAARILPIWACFCSQRATDRWRT